MSPIFSDKYTWGRHVFTLAALVVYCAEGFGWKPLKEISFVALFLCLGVCKSSGLSQFNWRSALLLGFALSGFFIPPIVQLSSIAVCFAMLGGMLNVAAALSFSGVVWGLNLGLFGLGLPPVFIGATASLVWVSISLLKTSTGVLVARGCICLYAFALIYQVLSLPLISVRNNQVAEFPYSIGESVENVVGRKLLGEASIINNEISAEVDPAVDTLIAEHGTAFPANAGVIGIGEYMQQRPWQASQIFAPELIRYVVSIDGMLVSNRGEKLSGGRVLLAVPTGAGSAAVVAIANDRLIFSDSDMLLNFLAPYQKNLLSLMSHSFGIMRILGFTCGVLLFLLCVFGSIVTGRVGVFLATSMLIAVVSIPLRRDGGDIRWEGTKSTWPHSTSGFGLVAAINKLGIQVKWGSRDTRVLCVSDGVAQARVGESLIFLDPGAGVKLLSGRLFVCGEAPVGNTEIVSDARVVQESSCKVPSSYKGIVEIDGVKIIGSGSPARQLNLKKWINQAIR